MNILFADDHDLVRDTLADAIGQHFDNAKVQVFCSVVDLISALKNGEPTDLVLLDWHLPNKKGADICRQICSLSPHVKLVVMSGDNRPKAASSALDAGAKGYIPKAFSPQQMLAALDLVHAGQRFIPDLIFQGQPLSFCMPIRPLPPEPLRRQLESLTTRESHILLCLATGDSNKAIARSIGLSEQTVKTHLKHIFSKVGLPNRSKGMVLARAYQGWLQDRI